MDDRFKLRWYSYIYQEMCEVNCIEPDNEFINFNQGKYNNISTAIKPENGVLMQCTGLKDKNGKLVYEGDIVATVIKNLGGKAIIDTPEVVEYDENFCMFRTHFSTLSKQTEVIGNIYENRELLNENS